MDENALSCKDKGILNNMRSLLSKRSRSKSFLAPNPHSDLKSRLSLSPHTSSNNLAPPGTLAIGPERSVSSYGKFRHNLSTSTGRDDNEFHLSIN